MFSNLHLTTHSFMAKSKHYVGILTSLLWTVRMTPLIWLMSVVRPQSRATLKLSFFVILTTNSGAELHQKYQTLGFTALFESFIFLEKICHVLYLTCIRFMNIWLIVFDLTVWKLCQDPALIKVQYLLKCKAVTVVDYLLTNGIHYLGVLVWHRVRQCTCAKLGVGSCWLFQLPGLYLR